MRKSTLVLSVFAAVALCTLMANFQPAALAQRGAPVAPNDECGDAINFSNISRTRFDTTGATTAANDPCISCCFFGVGQNSNSIWYSTTPAAGQVVRVGTDNSDYDTVVAVWKTTGNVCPTGTFVSNPPNSTCTNAAGVTEVNCDDDSGVGLTSSLAFVADGTSKYFIEVAECTGTTAGFGGTAVVNISVNNR